MSTHLAARAYSATKSFVIISILACFFGGALPSLRADECPPLGLGSYSDYFVGTNVTVLGGVRTGTVGIAECGEFIVAFEAEDQVPVTFYVCEGEDETEVSVTAWSGIYARRYYPDGTPYTSDPFILSAPGTDIHFNDYYQLFYDPSLAINRSNEVTVTFIGRALGGRDKIGCECPWPPPECPCASPSDAHLLLQANFPFETPPSPTPLPLSIHDWRELSNPSAGIAGDGSRRHIWGNLSGNEYACGEQSQCETPHTEEFGWFQGPNPTAADELLECDNCGNPNPPTDLCRFDNERHSSPCISVRSDKAFAVTWAEPVSPEFSFSSFDIKLRVFDSTGAQIGTDVLVNDPASETTNSDQVSPAVSMDDFGNVVVTWVGVRAAGCEPPFILPTWPVYARRFKFDSTNGLRDPDPELGEGIANPFIVDNLDDPDRGPLNQVHANPTVALTMEQKNAGAFFVAWNSWAATGADYEVHGQYFGPYGAPLGREFRAHTAVGPYEGYQTGYRLLAPSARHTAAYGNQGQVVFAYTWQHSNPSLDDEDQVWATLVPPGYGEYLASLQSCCKADVNNDGTANGLDIQPFINLVLEPPVYETQLCTSFPTFYYDVICPADTNNDGTISVADIPTFVTILLQVPVCSESPEIRGLGDCNGNHVPDANDIAEGTSQDCNYNYAPDECDIANETSVDVDENGVPDECQPDCNANGIPDVWDIDPEDPDGNEEVSADCNENGVPDECERDCNANGVPDDCDVDPLDPDGDEWVSADCNSNNVPDECERDCNENGVPDDCDMDPLDPDGDEWVSPDCNANEVPDECEFSLPPPFGSYDCNDNEVPDECDIADETSCDANENGVPDECDIALEACEDIDEDACCDEGESLMGGGEGGGESSQSSENESSENDSSEGESPCAELTEAECWELFFDWTMEQCWGPACPTSGLEQYQAVQQKLAELGLTWPM